MSRSSLWVMNKEYMGKQYQEFRNSWFFSPVIWGVLCEKYIADLIETSYGTKKNLIFNGELSNPLNDKINNSECLPDRICWELSNQQIFFSKDKDFIADNIEEFVKINTKYDRKSNGILPLKEEHIIARFKEVADAIRQIEKPYFVFKNSSCDDAVEEWFIKFDERSLEWVECSLSEKEYFVTEFVYIKNEEISFKSNIEFYGKEMPYM